MIRQIGGAKGRGGALLGKGAAAERAFMGAKGTSAASAAGTALRAGSAPKKDQADADAALTSGGAGSADEDGRAKLGRRLGAHERDEDLLDPSVRHAAQWAPLEIGAPAASPAPGKEAIAPHARCSMEELVPQLVRRIAWAGDRNKGTVQLELGAGPHAGTRVTVHSEGGRVRVELAGGGSSSDVSDLRDRIDERLRERGIALDSVEAR